MKRLLPLLLCLGLFSQCRRDYRPFDIYFWSSDTAGRYQLYLDRHFAGDLPCIGPHTEKESGLLQSQGLHRHLRSGRYAVDVYDDHGQRCWHGRLAIWVRRGNVSISSDMDDTHILTQGGAFMEEFFTKGAPK